MQFNHHRKNIVDVGSVHPKLTRYTFDRFAILKQDTHGNYFFCIERLLHARENVLEGPHPNYGAALEAAKQKLTELEKTTP